jgi:predicted dehydrogenase
MDENAIKRTSRRVFLGGAAASIGAPAFQRRLGANDRVRTAHVGVGNRGTELLRGFMEEKEVQVAALCDVYKPFLDRDPSKITVDAYGRFIRQMGEKFADPVDRYEDFRRVLDRKDIDAVVIATPDHWHAIQMIMACDAGKDVYVEKPLSATIVEGRRMVEAVKRNRRVVQVGLHRRSSEAYTNIAQLVQGGKIGKVTVARGYRISNMYPDGIGRSNPASPPPDFNWDLWLGPRPARPYQANIAPYRFRWWHLYSSQAGNWGVHHMDAMRWVLGEEAPASISAHGGRFAVNDDRTIPDTLETIFEFGSGRLMVWGQYEASGGSAVKSGEIEFRGTLGNLYSFTEGTGYSIEPSRGGQFQDPEPRLKPEEVRFPQRERNLTGLHIRNFLDCMASRKTPNCDIETGHRSNSFALLANIALETRARLDWDPKAERFTNQKEANKHLHYEYRAPWKLG